MVGTPWSDGVPGITQGQINPGCSFTFTWKATQHGSFYYHAHSSSQIDDGLYGPIIIHPAPSTSAPYELITKSAKSLSAIRAAEKTRVPLLISDWRHIESRYEWESSRNSGVENPCFDSILVNGKGKVSCLSKEQQAALITPTRQMLRKQLLNPSLTSSRMNVSKGVRGHIFEDRLWAPGGLLFALLAVSYSLDSLTADP